jgi:hypothetical protein
VVRRSLARVTEEANLLLSELNIFGSALCCTEFRDAMDTRRAGEGSTRRPTAAGQL